LGVFELAVLQRVLYPALIWRYENAKLTQTHGLHPDRIMLLLRLQSLLIMPIIGLFVGDRFKGIVG